VATALRIQFLDRLPTTQVAVVVASQVLPLRVLEALEVAVTDRLGQADKILAVVVAVGLMVIPPEVMVALAS
jgi:hypothetical protein